MKSDKCESQGSADLKIHGHRGPLRQPHRSTVPHCHSPMGLKTLFEKDSTHLFIIIIYLLLFCWQLNLYPGERYPEWDNHWGDVRLVGRIITIERALKNLELPAIDPYTGFGWNVAGDLFSPWGPLYLLGLVFRPQTVLWLFQFTFLTLAGVGTYFFLKRFIQDRFISLVGGLTYPTVWASAGGSMFFMHHGFISAIYFVPFSLILIHRILERRSPWNVPLFALYFACLYSSTDAFPLFIFPALVPFYTLIVAWLYYGMSFPRALKKSVLLLLLSLLAGSIYLVPMYWNCFTNSSALSLMREAVPAAVGERGAWHVSMGFLENLKYLGGLFSPMFTPTAGPYYGATYVCIGFYLTIVAALIFFRPLFGEKPRQVAIVVALLLLFPLMLLVDRLYWSDASKLIMSFRETASNIVSVPFNLNLLPYVVTLATFLCFGVIAKSNNRALKLAIYGALVIISLGLDWARFAGKAPWTPWYESSNRIRIPPYDVFGAFVWINLSAIAVMITYDFLGRTRDGHIRYSIYPVLVIVAILMRLFTITVYNDWNVRCGAGGRMLTRHPYRWNTHLQREAVIDQLIDRSDPNYRYLYCGPGGEHSRGDGRNWKVISARELHVVKRHKMLFSRKNFSHPYTGLMLGLSKGGGFRPWQHNPPLSRDVINNIENSKGLLGIKYVLSIHDEMDSPHLIYRGKVETEPFPRRFYVAATPDLIRHWSEVGPIYIYEVAEPTGIAFLVDEYEKVSVSKTLGAIYENNDHPWNRNLVYLEVDPATEPIQAVVESFAEGQAHARITQESSSTMEVDVIAPKEKYLVLGYLHRRFWKAYIGDTRVPIYRAYGGFMCVKTPPGKHTVRFRYTPYDVYLGMLLTISSFILPLGRINHKTTERTE